MAVSSWKRVSHLADPGVPGLQVQLRKLVYRAAEDICIWHLPGGDDLGVLHQLEWRNGGNVLEFPCCAESVRAVQIGR